jgi:hypothetical protein
LGKDLVTGQTADEPVFAALAIEACLAEGQEGSCAHDGDQTQPFASAHK